VCVGVGAPEGAWVSSRPCHPALQGNDGWGSLYISLSACSTGFSRKAPCNPVILIREAPFCREGLIRYQAIAVAEQLRGEKNEIAKRLD